LPSIIKVDQIQSDTGTVNQTSNLSFTGTGRRITGDFSNATAANRTAFQTGTTNDNTFIPVIGNGTGANNGIEICNSSDAGNAGILQLSSRTTDMRIAANARGTGSSLPITMHTGGSERLRITTAGVVELTSGQLKFPASQNASADANTLDDYEEGTWTPTITRASVSPSLTVSNSGRYVKIGRQVTVWGTITITAVASQGTNVWIITSLPFAQSGQRGAMGSAGNFSATSISTTTNVTEVGDSNADNYFYCANADGSLTNADFRAGTLYFTVTYES
jgi:hypothetical protein